MMALWIYLAGIIPAYYMYRYIQRKRHKEWGLGEYDWEMVLVGASVSLFSWLFLIFVLFLCFVYWLDSIDMSGKPPKWL
jgi:uncharacterized membrane-anchored protein